MYLIYVDINDYQFGAHLITLAYFWQLYQKKAQLNV